MPLHTIVQQQPHSCVTGFTCDRCKTQVDAGDVMEFQEHLHIRIQGGFASVWGDGTVMQVTLCQQCGFDLFSAFAVSDL